MRGLRVALSFLTVLPVAPKETTSGDLGSSLAWYGATGLAIGLFLHLLIRSATALAGPFPNTAPFIPLVILLFWILASRGLHIDGLGDLGDALFVTGGPERRRSVMKDPRLGVHGAVLLFIVLAAKTIALAPFAGASPAGEIPGGNLPAGIILIPAVARAGAALLLAVLPAAPGEGLAASLSSLARPVPIITANLAAILAGVAILGLSPSRLLLILLLAASVFFLLGLWARRNLGGVTGDVCGAGIEIAETLSLMVLSV